MDWKTMFDLKNNRKSLKVNIEKIRFYGKTKQEVRLLLSESYMCDCRGDFWCFIIGETWYGRRKTIKLIFEKNRVEEKYIKTEYGKLPITKLYKNLSGHY